MDVIAVVGAGKAARIRRAVRVPAVDQLRRTQPARHRRELAHQPRARSVTAPAANLAVDRGTDEFTDDGCGFTLNVVSTFYGQAHLRVDKTGQAFLVKDTFHFRDVATNPDTGRWFVVRGHGLFHDIKATQVEGTVYEFNAVEAGQPFVIEDAEGNVIAIAAELTGATD
jgi:hypothetical protein